MFFKKVITKGECAHSKKYYFLGIPYYKVTYKNFCRKKYFLGICYHQNIDFNSLISKVTQHSNSELMEYFSSQKEIAPTHQKFLLPYKNKHIGKECVICGSGPTINFYTPLKNSIHFGLNRVYEKETIHFDYLMFWDHLNLKKDDPQFVEKIKNYSAQFFVGKFINQECPTLSDKDIMAIGGCPVYSSAFWGYSLNTYDGVIHYDIEKEPLMDFGSVAFGAFHLCLYMGFKKIYLAGIDNSLNGYFKAEHTQRFLATQTIFEGWKKVKDFVAMFYPDVEIISINPVGLKGLFKDVYTKDYLKTMPNIDIENINILK